MPRKTFFRIIIPALLVLVACSPQTYSLNVDLRGASQTGLSLAGKDMAVCYFVDGHAADSVFLSGVAEGFTKAMENDYFGGSDAMGIYSVKKQEGRDSYSRQSMADLVVDTGGDVAFLFDVSLQEPVFQKPEKVNSATSADSVRIVKSSYPFHLDLHVYDAMNPQDTVLVYCANTSAASWAYTSEAVEPDSVLAEKSGLNLYDSGKDVGRMAANIFLSTWSASSFSVYYYPGEIWEEAAYAAYSAKWANAIKIWLSLLDTKNLYKRACAEYNIALGLFLTGNAQLALKWLDRADEDYLVPSSSSLRRKIKDKM